ncbi:MAG TPA: diguanylate cyclase, partial [Gammaproteobacteria bacterium]|nr:diguanylate cyclase [Gammaproteobacteria bacterium]
MKSSGMPSESQHRAVAPFSSGLSAWQRLWLAMAAGVLLFAAVLYLLDVPRRLQGEEQGQVAIQLLDRMRRPLLHIKRIQVQYTQGEADAPALDEAVDEARELLRAYLQAAAYNPELAARAKRFAATFDEWVTAERNLFEHVRPGARAEPDKAHLAGHLVRADTLFLEALDRLGEGEPTIHRDIAGGQRAEEVLQAGGALLMLYLFLLVFLHQRQVNRVLAASEEDLHTTLLSIGDAVIATDAAGRVTRMNPVAERLTGWRAARARGRPLDEVFRIVNAETGDPVDSPVDKVMREGSVIGLANHTLLIARDGSRYQIADSGAPIHGADGSIKGVVLVFRDVSDEYRLQRAVQDQARALEYSNRRLEEAQRIARLGHWELDLENDELHWSDEIYRIFELDPVRFQPSYEKFLEVIHPDDRERVERAYREAVEQKKPYDLVHRLLLKDGRVRYVRERAETEYDADGRPLRSLGTVQDVTEQVEAEQELRLAATTFNTHAGIMITDAQGTILRVNPAQTRLTGYSAQELVGANPRLLKSGRQDADFYRRMWRQLTDTGHWEGELWNRRKDGSLYAEWLTITAVRDEAGEVTHYVGTTQDITERKRAEARIEHLAYYDDLTDLANRRLLRDRLQQEMAVARRHDAFGALLYLDLDRFKNLNDALGHPVGDELLRQAGARLKQLVRAEDTVARLGGDEFVVLLPAHRRKQAQAGFDAQAAAEKIRVHLSEPYDLDGHSYHISVSIGIVLFPEGQEDADDVLKHADSALYRAKDEGRNTVRFYRPSMQATADARLALERDLRHALLHDQLSLHYQPKVDDSGAIIGAEALLRWRHPERGDIPPAHFIPVAEETGLIGELGAWVLRTSLGQYDDWLQAGLPVQDMRMAINVSARQFHEARFVDQVLGICADAGVSPERVELEITESLVMADVGDAIEKIQRLRAQGIHFSIDDFGTGYSSLAYLKRLPVDWL